MRALICGVAGQDGAYLASFLLDKGYEVIGTSRDAATSGFANLDRLGVRAGVTTVSMALNDFHSVIETMRRFRPDEVYNLAGQSSVALSFEQPVETLESIVVGTLNLLEALRFMDAPVRLYSAGSSESFGNIGEVAANEATPFRPRSPYGVAKASACQLVANYREAYGLAACTGILFNHESPLRPRRFVTQKIVHGAARIAAGHERSLQLGNIDIQRDWGWAPEYVEAMWRMLQVPRLADYVIATGRTVPLTCFIDRAFAHFGLDWREHVVSEAALLRPSDIAISQADPSRAEAELGWCARVDVETVVERMCEAARENLAGGR